MEAYVIGTCDGCDILTNEGLFETEAAAWARIKKMEEEDEGANSLEVYDVLDALSNGF